MKCTVCHAAIKPIVAVDIDGTIGDYYTHFVEFAEGYLGRWLPKAWTGDPEDWEEYLGIPKDVYRDIKLAYRQGGMKRTMPMIPGADKMMQRFVLEGAEVWITTARPWNRLDSIDPDTQEWLRRNLIPYDHLLYDEDKYQRLFEIVGKDRVCAVLEDLPEQLARVEEVFGAGTAVARYALHNMDRIDIHGANKLETCGSIISTKIGRWFSEHGV